MKKNEMRFKCKCLALLSHKKLIILILTLFYLQINLTFYRSPTVSIKYVKILQHLIKNYS